MKKVISLLLALVLCVSLAACGGSKGPSDEQLTAITNAYNEAADLYEEISSNAQANGWMDDQETADAIKALGDKLDPIGKALDSKKFSDLGKDVDFDTLPGEIRGYLPELEALEEKVSKKPLNIPEAIMDTWLSACTELRQLYDEAYALADTNGYLAAQDEYVTYWLGAIKEYLEEELEAGFPNNPEYLEDEESFTKKYRHYLSAVHDVRMGLDIPYDVANGRDAG